MSANGFLAGLLRRDADESDGSGTTYSGQEIGVTRRASGKTRALSQEGRLPRDLTVERLAGAIADLPPDVPRESAVPIVRKTLDAAGVRLSEVDESTREQESRLSSEIGLAEDRREELREKTQETVRSLEEEIRKAREACEDVVAYEDRKISRDRALLGEVRRVRAFFELPGTEGGEEDAGRAEVDVLPGPKEQGPQKILETSDAAKARRMRDFFGSAEVEGEKDAGPAEQGTQQIIETSVVRRRRISDAPFGPTAGG